MKKSAADLLVLRGGLEMVAAVVVVAMVGLVEREAMVELGYLFVIFLGVRELRCDGR